MMIIPVAAITVLGGTVIARSFKLRKIQKRLNGCVANMRQSGAVASSALH